MAGERLLIVEDEPQVARDMRLVLQYLGYSVVATVPSGEDAIRVAGEVRPELVLMDILLHGTVDGIAAAQAIRDQYGLPVVYLTARADEETLERARVTDPYGYLLKPFHQEDLHATLQVALHRHRLERALRDSQQALRDSRDELEARVRDRTAELQQANEALRALVADRGRAEEAVRRSEGRVRALIDNSSDAIVVVGADGTVQYTSPAVVRINGYAEGEFLGRTGFDLIHPEDRDRILALFHRLAQEPRGRVTAEYRVRHRDGSWQWMEGVATNLLEEPDVQGIVVNYRDITERKRLEEELRQAHKMEAVGRLAGGVAHDFNNLLTVILGYTSLLLTRVAPGDPTREALYEVRKAGERAASLTQQLLAFGRKQVLAPALLNVNTLVADLGRMLHRLIGEHIEFVTDLDPGVALVKVDGGQIEQVLMNLAANARDAMPQGGRLTIATRNVELDEPPPVSPPDAGGGYRGVWHPELRPGRYVLLSVRDTGVGMDEETRAHVFEPFFSTKALGKGTGLGLAMVYGVIKQSGGHVEIESAAGEGTTLKIYLPRAVGEPPPAPPDSGRIELPHGLGTILVAEDADDVRTLTRTILESQGYTVLEARDGEEALTIAERQSGTIDLLVTDVIMPRMNGRELAERLVARRPGLRVLYLSGYAEDPGGNRTPLVEGAAFLGKPFKPVALARKVSETLAQPVAPSPAGTDF
jgi:PAS domain S-box-containing protein